MNTPTVTVLLSTYNGSKFVKTQIISVLEQKNVSITLLVRDDGSTDSTIRIIEDLCKENPNIVLVKGNNVGSAKSFFKLLDLASRYPAEYYALCDQDDVWLPEKLSNAVSCLNDKTKIPALYCSNLNVVDSNLVFIKKMYPLSTRPHKYESLLTNIVTGCTCVFNQSLLDIYLKLPKPNYVAMHDWWLYCTASFYGEVIFDHSSYINYRQHSGNVLGARVTTRIQKLKNLLNSLLHSEDQHYRLNQAKEFLRVNHKNIKHKTKDLQTIQLISTYNKNIINRIKLATHKDIIKGVKFPLRIRILLGII